MELDFVSENAIFEKPMISKPIYSRLARKNLIGEGKFSLALEHMIWIPVAVMDQTWLMTKSSLIFLTWRWMLSPDQRFIRSFCQQRSTAWKTDDQ